MSEPSEPREHVVGAHSVRFEEPDLYIIRHVGNISGPEMVALYEHVDAFASGKASVFGIIDQSDAGATLPDARRTVIAHREIHKGIVFLNTPILEKVGISIGSKASVMLSRGHQVPHTFASTEAEARAWIDDQRKLLPSKSRA